MTKFDFKDKKEANRLLLEGKTMSDLARHFGYYDRCEFHRRLKSLGISRVTRLILTQQTKDTRRLRRQKIYDTERRKCTEYKESRRKYNQTENRKEIVKISNRKYRKTEKYKDWLKAYKNTPEAKLKKAAANKRYNDKKKALD